MPSSHATDACSLLSPVRSLRPQPWQADTSSRSAASRSPSLKEAGPEDYSRAAVRNVLPRETVFRGRPIRCAVSYVRSYLWLRAFVGILGILVPLVLVFAEPALFDDRPFMLGSLSAYYYSGVRDFFVGSLCAIGVFLVAYKIVDRSWENLVSIAAAIAVIAVALFPTSRPGTACR